MAAAPEVLVLGIGNILWADEGFGVRVVEEMQRRFRFPENVRLLDGGTQGIYLVDQVRSADILVVFDAVDYGLPPGTLKLVEGDQVPKFMGAKKMSLHQTGFQEVLAMAELMGDYPQHLLLIGVPPLELEDFGGSLRPQIKEQMTPAVERALEYLAGFGVVASPRDDSDDAVSDNAQAALTLTCYESDRPPEELACRIGDARVLSRRGKA